MGEGTTNGYQGYVVVDYVRSGQQKQIIKKKKQQPSLLGKTTLSLRCLARDCL